MAEEVQKRSQSVWEINLLFFFFLIFQLQTRAQIQSKIKPQIKPQMKSFTRSLLDFQ
jgi:hypothetical protein